MDCELTKYTLIDSGNFQKLEQVGPYRIIRPSLQSIWEPLLSLEEWGRADAIFSPQRGGRGRWVFHRQVDEAIPIGEEGMRFELRLTPFGHLGLFPEQFPNWKKLREVIKGRPLQVLNLFAYTGGASLACVQGGASVTHVDASKGAVDWARYNANLSNLEEMSIRWIVDDVSRFVAREKRRGKVYDGVILTPPSFGRGPKGQVWKMEENLLPLLKAILEILDSQVEFVLLSCHSPGYTPIGLQNILKQLWSKSKYVFRSNELCIMDQQGRQLPSGACCWILKG